mgnify:CR=1 FL=1
MTSLLYVKPVGSGACPLIFSPSCCARGRKGIGDRLCDRWVEREAVRTDGPSPLNDPWEIRDRLDDKLVAVIDAGSCGVNPTTVIDMTGTAPEILRRGAGDVGFMEPAGATG